MRNSKNKILRLYQEDASGRLIFRQSDTRTLRKLRTIFYNRIIYRRESRRRGQSFRIDVNRPRKKLKRRTFLGQLLIDKQKFKFFYGNIREYQLRNLFYYVFKNSRNVQKSILYLLEARLDLALYRLNFVPNLFIARKIIKKYGILCNYLLIRRTNKVLKIGDILNFYFIEQDKFCKLYSSNLHIISYKRYLLFKQRYLSHRKRYMVFLKDIKLFLRQRQAQQLWKHRRYKSNYKRSLNFKDHKNKLILRNKRFDKYVSIYKQHKNYRSIRNLYPNKWNYLRYKPRTTLKQMKKIRRKRKKQFVHRSQRQRYISFIKKRRKVKNKLLKNIYFKSYKYLKRYNRRLFYKKKLNTIYKNLRLRLLYRYKRLNLRRSSYKLKKSKTKINRLVRLVARTYRKKVNFRKKKRINKWRYKRLINKHIYKIKNWRKVVKKRIRRKK